jgi:DNA-binding response OmpR family regulator
MRKYTILIVDDEMVFAQSLKNYLLEEGDKYIVKTAYNGLEALQIVEKEKMDLVILDLNMPVVDGIQFLTELYNRNIWLPIIVLTNILIMTPDEERDIFGEFGIADYIDKPVNLEELSEKIEVNIKRKGMGSDFRTLT